MNTIFFPKRDDTGIWFRICPAGSTCICALNWCNGRPCAPPKFYESVRKRRIAIVQKAKHIDASTATYSGHDIVIGDSDKIRMVIVMECDTQDILIEHAKIITMMFAKRHKKTLNHTCWNSHGNQMVCGHIGFMLFSHESMLHPDKDLNGHGRCKSSFLRSIMWSTRQNTHEFDRRIRSIQLERT